MNFFRKKNIQELLDDSKKHNLKKTLTAFDLIMLGIGATIGTGIFVVTGIAAAKYAGPAISISYLVAAFACIFAALAYAELASMVPISGSAYTYSYVTMGEFIAWLVGWGLILEYGVGAATVAVGWSGYMVGVLNSAGIFIPEALTKAPSIGGLINLPAIFISLFIGVMLYRGMKEGVTLNRILVGIKLVVIFLFLLMATPMIETKNWSDFTPFGINGILMGAAVVFYAYIGFDCIATAAEECKNPKRDLPIGIIGSLIICTILYSSVSLVLLSFSFILWSFLPALIAAQHGTTGHDPGHPAFTGLKAGFRGLSDIQTALDGAKDPKSCGEPPCTVVSVLVCTYVDDGIACYCTQGFGPEPR